MPCRVFVTGLGVVSPIGTGVEAYWRALLHGINGPASHPTLSPGRLENQRYYAVEDSPSAPAPDVPMPASRATLFALQATRLAFDHAGISLPFAAVERHAGVSLGTGMGENDLFEAVHKDHGRAPALPAHFSFSNVSATVARACGFSGPNLTLSTACSAGSYAVSLAQEAIRSGTTDLMVAGGAEVYSRIGQGCFSRLGALDPVVCRPFDANRKGTVFGEGAGILILESEERVNRRGWTRILAEVKGTGWSCDGYHPTAPEPSGHCIELAIRRALDEASLGPDDIDCVVPHGTGTALNDVVETQTLARLFNGRLKDVKITAIKAQVGHSGGAAGALSCLTAAMILDRGVVPPTAHVTMLDAECGLPIHTGAPLWGPIRNVLVNAYAFGGNNISVILGRPDATHAS